MSLLVAGEAGASNAGKHDADTLAKEADERPGASASAAANDRQGKLRAITPEEARALVQGMARYVDQSSEGLTPVQQQNGVMAIDLQDRFQSVSMARVSTDGKPVVRCVSTKREAEQFLSSGKSTRKSGSKQARARKSTAAPAAPTTAMTTTSSVLEEK